jgi:hypothetical protein
MPPTATFVSEGLATARPVPPVRGTFENAEISQKTQV